MQALAEKLAGVLRADAEYLFPDRLLSDASPKREIWSPLLRALMPEEAVRESWAAFLAAPYIFNEALAQKHRDHFGNFYQNTMAALWPREGGAAFDAAAVRNDVPLNERLNREDAVRACALLARDPHPFFTFLALHDFYGSYCRDLGRAVLAVAPELSGNLRVKAGFAKVQERFDGNAHLFATLLVQAVLVQDQAARVAGREPGEFTRQDFAAFGAYATPQHIFADTVKGTACPFARLVKLAGGEVTQKNKTVQPLFDAGLWTLHEKMRPLTEEQGAAWQRIFKIAAAGAASAWDVRVPVFRKSLPVADKTRALTAA